MLLSNSFHCTPNQVVRSARFAGCVTVDPGNDSSLSSGLSSREAKWLSASAIFVWSIFASLTMRSNSSFEYCPWSKSANSFCAFKTNIDFASKIKLCREANLPRSRTWQCDFLFRATRRKFSSIVSAHLRNRFPHSAS